MSIAISKPPRRKKTPIDFASSGPGTLGGTLLRKFWQPVYRADDLAAGEMKPIQILNEQFTLYRGESGTPHVVGFRCPHRNTQLSPGWVRGDSVQCLYHGWRFASDGACIERPGEQPSGPCAHVSIPAYPTHEHMGLIYAYFGAGDAPAFPGFPMFDGDGIVETMVKEFPCNWFQTYENQVDEVHAAFVHGQSGSHALLEREINLPETVVSETEYGFERVTWSGNGPRRLCVYPFPNHMRMMTGVKALELPRPIDGYLTLVPTTDEQHLLFTTLHVRITDETKIAEHRERQRELRANLAKFPPIADVARDILAGKMTLKAAMDHPLKNLIEDVVAQLGQGPIHDRTKEVLGRTDVGIARIRQIFERELRAVANGDPGKDWNFTRIPAPTTGFS